MTFKSVFKNVDIVKIRMSPFVNAHKDAQLDIPGRSPSHKSELFGSYLQKHSPYFYRGSILSIFRIM
jgi:hypothetical protein